MFPIEINVVSNVLGVAKSLVFMLIPSPKLKRKEEKEPSKKIPFIYVS